MKEVTIIAGATGGLGKAVAKEAARRGYNLVLIARDAHKLESLKCEILQKTKDIETVCYVVDIKKTSEEELQKIFSEIFSKFNRIDYLINCIGIGGWWPIEEIPLKLWNDMLNVNVTGAFLICKYATIYMKKQNKGVIVNVSSVAGKKGASYSSAYCASKFSIVGLSYALAEELNKYEIKVIVVILGSIETDFVRKALFNSSPILTEYIQQNYLQCNNRIKTEQVAKEILSHIDLPKNAPINEIVIKKSMYEIKRN